MTRNVFPIPGITKNSPTSEFTSRFSNESNLLFPGRSGIARVFLSTTITKPGKSPFGEISGRLSAPRVATITNVDAAMNRAAYVIDVVDDLFARPMTWHSVELAQPLARRDHLFELLRHCRLRI